MDRISYIPQLYAVVRRYFILSGQVVALGVRCLHVIVLSGEGHPSGFNLVRIQANSCEACLESCDGPVGEGDGCVGD